jgi:hypothetical protein
MSRAAVAVALLLGAACVPSEGPLMEPGQDCLRCHDGGEARRWTVAGTWAPRGTQVTIADSAGKSFTLRTNDVGNFYTAESLQFPLTVSVQGTPMPTPATYGGCNRCHAGGVETGPLMLPGEDCLACHDGNGVTRFSAAGTWTGPGLSVRLVDAKGTAVDGSKEPTLVTNAAGNFYTTAPLVLPLQSASVGGRTMSQPPYSGCNSCHPRGADAGD